MIKHFLTILLVVQGMYCLSQSAPEQQSLVNDSVQILLDQSDTFRSESLLNKSLDFAIQAVNKSYELTDDDYSKAEALYVLGNCFDQLKDFDNAKKQFTKAIEFAEKSQNNSVLINAYNGLGNIYSDTENNIIKGLVYYEKSGEYARISKRPKDLFISMSNIAWTYLDINRPDKAKEYLDQAKQAFEDSKGTLKSNSYSSNLNILFGMYYKAKGNLKGSLKYLSMAESLAKEDKLYEELIDIHDQKFEIYTEQDSLREAIESLKDKARYKELLIDIDEIRDAEDIKATFELQEYKRELELVETEKRYLEDIAASKQRIIVISIIAIILLLGTMVFMYTSFRRRKERDKLLASNEELAKAKKKAEQLTYLKSDFIATVSHELRTPLYGVIGITSLLLDDDSILEKHQETLKSLKFSGDHLLEIVNGVLRVGKIESQNETLTTTDVVLDELITNIANSTRIISEKKGNTLHLDLDPNIHGKTYRIDSLKLTEVLYNLITNAIKFTENGEITISVRNTGVTKTKDHLYFSVADTGVGIPLEEQDEIFKSYKQVDEDQKDVFLGTGLGLSIVKNILEHFGSTIKVDSAEGKGSTFSFDLTLTRSVVDRKVLTNEIVCLGDHSKTILVAEDNEISQMVTGKLLDQLAYKCIIAEDGRRAIDLYDPRTVDLILMDLNMPDLNGFDASLKILSEYPDTKIIALTATDIHEVRDRCLGVGMIDVLNKPINKEELHKALNRYLGE